jgi:hypothetical protein
MMALQPQSPHHKRQKRNERRKRTLQKEYGKGLMRPRTALKKARARLVRYFLQQLLKEGRFHELDRSARKIHLTPEAVQLADLQLRPVIAWATFDGWIDLDAQGGGFSRLAKALAEKPISEQEAILQAIGEAPARTQPPLSARQWSRRITRTVRRGQLWLAALAAPEALIITDRLAELNRDEQKRASRAVLGKRTVLTRQGERTLEQVAVIAEAARIGELRKRLLALVTVALRAELAPYLITLTCPPHLHPSSPHYDFTSPSKALEYLQGRWERFQRFAGRATQHWEPLEMFFVRGLDGYDDATPHLHLIAFFKADDLPRVRDALARYFIDEEPPERRRLKKYRHRVHIQPIEYLKDEDDTEFDVKRYVWQIFWAICYAVKGLNLKRPSASEAALRASTAPVIDEVHINAIAQRRLDAFCAVLGGRRFAIGATHLRMPSITVFRELKKIEKGPEKGGALDRLWRAARADDHVTYLTLLLERHAQGLAGPKLISGPARISADGTPMAGAVIGVGLDGQKCFHAPPQALEAHTAGQDGGDHPTPWEVTVLGQKDRPNATNEDQQQKIQVSRGAIASTVKLISNTNVSSKPNYPRNLADPSRRISYPFVGESQRLHEGSSRYSDRTKGRITAISSRARLQRALRRRPKRKRASNGPIGWPHYAWPKTACYISAGKRCPIEMAGRLGREAAEIECLEVCRSA